MNAPRLDETTSVGDHDRANIVTPGEGLIGEREVGQRLVHRDVHGDVGAATAVVGEDCVRHRRLVGVSTAGDRTVGKHKAGRKCRVNAPREDNAAGVGDHHRPNINASCVRLVGEREISQRLVDGDVHRDVG